MGAQGFDVNALTMQLQMQGTAPVLDANALTMHQMQTAVNADGRSVSFAPDMVTPGGNLQMDLASVKNGQLTAQDLQAFAMTGTGPALPAVTGLPSGFGVPLAQLAPD